MIKLAFYGKGGIGKSTAASNVSVALAQKGLKVMHVLNAILPGNDYEFGMNEKGDENRGIHA